MYMYLLTCVCLSMCTCFSTKAAKRLESGLRPRLNSQHHRPSALLLMVELLRDLIRTLNHGNYGIFLIMGNARFMSSTVFQQIPKGSEVPI